MDFSQLLDQINETGFSVLDPSKRLFWGNIIGALLLLLIVPGRGKLDRFRILFAKSIWLHPSSLADMKVIAINAVLRMFLFTGSLFSSMAIAAWVSLLLRYLFRGRPNFDLHPTVLAAAFTLTLFLADDYARYFVHRLQHKIPSLWLFHQTHHSALVLTPLTLLRTHPVEILTARLRNAITYGVVTGVFFYLLGSRLTAWDILGIEVVGFAFNFLGANLRHSQVWIHFGPLESLIISPAAHQVHHSRDPEHFDKNFGVCLAIWDRLGGTHLDPRRVQAPLQFGLDDSPLSSAQQSVLTLYLQPFLELKDKILLTRR